MKVGRGAQGLGLGVRTTRLLSRMVRRVDELLVPVAAATMVVDQEVAGDREEPGPRGRPVGVEARPGPQRPLEGGLGEVLRLLARAQAVGQKAVDLEDLAVVYVDELGLRRSQSPRVLAMIPRWISEVPP